MERHPIRHRTDRIRMVRELIEVAPDFLELEDERAPDLILLPAAFAFRSTSPRSLSVTLAPTKAVRRSPASDDFRRAMGPFPRLWRGNAPRRIRNPKRKEAAR